VWGKGRGAYKKSKKAGTERGDRKRVDARDRHPKGKGRKFGEGESEEGKTKNRTVMENLKFSGGETNAGKRAEVGKENKEKTEHVPNQRKGVRFEKGKDDRGALGVT